jgi:transposase
VAFFKDGRMEIDNNLVENIIRPTVLGKENRPFMGGADAGELGVIIYTVKSTPTPTSATS